MRERRGGGSLRERRGGGSLRERRGGGSLRERRGGGSLRERRGGAVSESTKDDVFFTNWYWRGGGGRGVSLLSLTCLGGRGGGDVCVQKDPMFVINWS